ncbi:50S ribosomal protein L17 [Candidatus Wolfebacteria bacterium]|nr:MAG: 50S ribosomal protein L17 [Candidatus Wolfebacteria bacterium]
MQHRKSGRKLGRVTRQRSALLKGLARSLVLEEGINTTEAKAKELRPFVEKLITKGKSDSVAARRMVSARLDNNSEAVQKIFTTLGPKYKDRNGGYTRITKMPTRQKDASKMARIEFV